MDKLDKNSIAILDSGYDMNNKLLTSYIDYACGIYNGEINTQDFNDENGHGTQCISTIHRISNNATFCVIKILNANLEGSSDDVLAALEMLYHTDIRVINLSLSTEELAYKDKYMEICKRLRSRGKFIICSKSNYGDISYPASLAGAMGVKGSIYLNQNEFCFNQDLDFQVLTSSLPAFTISLNNQYCFFGGNSRAAAIFSAIIHNQLIKCNYSEDELNMILNEKSLEYNLYEEKNRQISYLRSEEDYTDYNRDTIIIEDIVCNALELTTEKRKLLHKYKLYHTAIGLNAINSLKIIQDMEKEFNRKINYENVDLFDFESINSLSKIIS